MTTVEAGSERFNALKEPLATLTRYRRGEDGEVYFGQNLAALNGGGLKRAARIEGAGAGRAPVYPNAAPKSGSWCASPGTPGRDLKPSGSRPPTASPARLPAWPAPAHQPRYQKTRVQRRYTLSSTPGGPSYSISVKKLADGRLSPGCTMRLKVGDHLLAAPGRRVSLRVRAQAAAALGGIGVTPCSPLPALWHYGELGDVHFMHLCRSEADIPAASELHAMAQQGMTLTLILSQPDANTGRGSAAV